jgi:hypothetical protein
MGPPVVRRGVYVIAEVVEYGCNTRLDVVPGADLPMYPGAKFVGVWGVRQSSTSISGTLPPTPVAPGFNCDFLGIGGIVGVSTDYRRDGAAPTRVRILGSLYCADKPADMRSALGPISASALPPLVLVAGSSAEIGKTRTTSALISRLVADGHRVAGIKLTGSGRMRDLIWYVQAGAHWTLDFVDAGLESTYDRPGEEVAMSAKNLMRACADLGAQVIVGEIGGDLISSGGMAVFNDQVVRSTLRAVVLTAADPLAAVGLETLLADVTGPVPTYFGPMRRNNAVSAAVTRTLVKVPIITDLAELAAAVCEDVAIPRS